jgi:hypothetical protein
MSKGILRSIISSLFLCYFPRKGWYFYFALRATKNRAIRLVLRSFNVVGSSNRSVETFFIFRTAALLRVANATSFEGHTTLYNLFFILMLLPSKRMVCHTKLQQERSMVPRAGFEPAQAISPKDFKSFASTISPPRHIYFFWRRHPDLNRGSGFCRPTPYHLAMPPLQYVCLHQDLISVQVHAS